jgi:phospholipid transport system substrate-binding protein
MSQTRRRALGQSSASGHWFVLRLLRALCTVALLGGLTGGARAEESPGATVRRLLEALNGYRGETMAPLSAADREHNSRVIRVARESLGLQILATRALGAHWSALTEAQRGEFINLLNSLLERKAYPKSATFFGDLRVDYLGEVTGGNRATVHTRVVHPKEGEISIDYTLERSGGRWLIVDVSLDDVSLATDIRTQVHKILTEQSYTELIRRMKEKLAEG